MTVWVVGVGREKSLLKGNKPHITCSEGKKPPYLRLPRDLW